MTITKTLAAVALALGMASAPALAQQQEGLINVNVSDVDVGLNVSVQAPIGIAANVCGVAVNVLARQLPGDVSCEADAQAAADNEQFMRFADEQGHGQAIRDAVAG
jgi:hypothetical protein